MTSGSTAENTKESELLSPHQTFEPTGPEYHDEQAERTGQRNGADAENHKKAKDHSCQKSGFQTVVVHKAVCSQRLGKGVANAIVS